MPARLLRIGLWIAAITLLIVGAAAIWVWNQRYALMERQAITYLQSMGVTADLRIRSATGTEADVRNIRLSYEDTPFLTIDRMQATYQWRDLLNGQVERLDFTGLNASVTVDEDGNIIDGWRPPSTGGGAGLPIQGIGLDDAAIELRTPYGTVPFSGDMEIDSLQTFTVSGQIARTALTRDDVSVQLEGPINFTRDGDPLRVSMPDTQISVAHPSASLNQTRLSLSAVYDPTRKLAEGTLELNGGTFDSAADMAGTINRLSIDGGWHGGDIDANIDANLSRLVLTDEARRNDLARTLSLSEVLADVPVAQNFAPSLVRPIRDMLSGSSLDGSFRLQLSDRTRTVSLRRPATLQSLGDPTRQVILSSVDDAPAYRYYMDDPAYQLALQANLSRPIPLTLTPLRLTIRSDNGLIPTGTEAASGSMTTGASWQAQTRTGRPARLAPLSIDFDYQAPLDAASRLSLNGGAIYDGDLPGGYVENLRASGVIETTLQDGAVAMNFRPNRILRFDRLETTSEWIVEDFSGTLRPNGPVYARRATGPATVRTGLTEAKLSARRPASEAAPAAELDLQIGAASVVGSVADTDQDWAVDFEQVALQSDTFPVERTDLTLPDGELSVRLTESGRSEFSLSTPSSTLITPGYRVRDMALTAAGTAEAYALTFTGGRVRVIPPTADGPPIPVLNASGELRFADGQFTGTAQTVLPQVPGNPIDIAYRLVDGRGEAEVSIRDLRFRPGGLQPQELAPALRGKIAQVDGSIDADLRIAFGGDEPITGSGQVQISDMSLGTAPGPVTGLSGTIELTSLFPVVTAPDQILRIASFDPGIPLLDGTLTYALVSDGVAISDAIFPIGDGRISFDPFIWTYGAEENRVTLRVSDVQIGEFLNDIGDGRLSVTGAIEGEIPVVVRGINVNVENGRLQVPNGGTIRYSGDNPIGDTDANPAATAFKALENFNYQALFAEIDGPLDGAVNMGLLFTGSNPDVLFGVPFQFDMTIEGELFNIARSLNPNGLQERVIASVASQQLERSADDDSETDD
ncbi:YdbH domain-containing protein [Algimonas porphyrae]|uniref:Dicarboxylate transport domain-containing protein n=1 Tax=Algimonas porphyrae TaxID=1128113 RepID=A0ABQ5V214_9PROT|nr:YdbH domain-containing protein [Algimonas porphyrae]GLQ21100.1 hypothetical protein GCM10007854_20550 [Algimonas porphyrae]